MLHDASKLPLQPPPFAHQPHVQTLCRPFQKSTSYISHQQGHHRSVLLFNLTHLTLQHHNIFLLCRVHQGAATPEPMAPDTAPPAAAVSAALPLHRRHRRRRSPPAPCGAGAGRQSALKPLAWQAERTVGATGINCWCSVSCLTWVFLVG